MFQEFFSSWSHPRLLVLPLIGMLLCFFAFVAVLVRLLVGKRKGESLEHVAALPLDDEVVVGRMDGRSAR